MKFHFNKDGIIREFVPYFSKNAEKFNLGQGEIPKVKEYTENFLDAIEKVQNDGYLKDGISEQKLTELLNRTGKLHEPVGMLHNTLTNYVCKTEGLPDPSRVLRDEKGNIYQFGVSEILIVSLLIYTSHCELAGNILKNIFDFKKINSSLPNQKQQREYILENDRITLNPIMNVLKEYLGFDIFPELDLDLRNKISHWDFELDLGNKEIVYAQTRKPLSEILELCKKANLFFVFISLAVERIKDSLH